MAPKAKAETNLSQHTIEELDQLISKANEEKQARLIAELEPKKKRYAEIKAEAKTLLEQIRVIEPGFDSPVAKAASIQRIVKELKAAKLVQVVEKSGMEEHEVKKILEDKVSKKLFVLNEKGEYSLAKAA